MRIFTDFLAGPAQRASALYLLGDLFETWVGDDDLDDPTHQIIIQALYAARATGLDIALLHGNRDFLLGTGFATASGVRLLPDPYVLSTPDWQFVLAHGDALCTDDVDYQAFRQQVRGPAWQADFLARPLIERRATAAALRARSEAGKADKTSSVMDLNPAATDDFLRAHGYATFIHGHTHRPARHDHVVDGIHVERWVLADWHENRGEVLAWDGRELQRIALT